MQPKACEACAKRKVRCDGERPCYHCKRRKQDHCSYPKRSTSQLPELPTSAEKTNVYPKTPESIERATPVGWELGAPDAQKEGSAADQSQVQPLMVASNGKSIYLESPAWENWNGQICGPVQDLRPSDQRNTAHTTLNVPKLVALQSILNPDPSIELSKIHPAPQDAATLWKTYSLRVNPLLKITFDWQLAKLRGIATSPSDDRSFTYPEHALAFAIYFTSVRSLTDEECTRSLNQSRSALLLHYQQLCEQALVNSHFFTSSELTVLQAMTTYICGGFGVMSSRSLQTLVGLVIRNGERIGLHRDGSILNLSPHETEQRRRIWWQLQQLDLGLSVNSGSTSINLTGEWDTAIPLNIEDTDLNLDMHELPEERKGLTSMSYCLSTYWLIQEMRSLCIKNFGKFSLSWPSEKTWSLEHKRSIIERLEDGMNEKFLKYCDPIRPLDTFMQLVARLTICTLRRFMLHPLVQNGTVTADHRKEILDLSVNCLEYDIAMNSTPAFQPFRWRLIGSFPWSALIYVLVEAHQRSTASATEELWALISHVYNANGSLFNLADDRRKPYAAKLLLAAWDARVEVLAKSPSKDSLELQPRSKPLFLRQLESKLSAGTPDSSSREQRGHTEHAGEEQEEHNAECNVSETRSSCGPSFPSQAQQAPSISSTDELNTDTLAFFNPDEIDWLFWDAQLEDLAD